MSRSFIIQTIFAIIQGPKIVEKSYYWPVYVSQNGINGVDCKSEYPLCWRSKLHDEGCKKTDAVIFNNLRFLMCDLLRSKRSHGIIV